MVGGAAAAVPNVSPDVGPGVVPGAGKGPALAHAGGAWGARPGGGEMPASSPALADVRRELAARGLVHPSVTDIAEALECVRERETSASTSGRTGFWALMGRRRTRRDAPELRESHPGAGHTEGYGGHRGWGNVRSSQGSATGPRSSREPGTPGMRGECSEREPWGRPPAYRGPGALAEGGTHSGPGQMVEHVKSIQRELLGFGVLAIPLGDPRVTDVVVNGDGAVWVDAGDGMERTAYTLSPEEVRGIAVRMAEAGGARLDDAAPFADAVVTHLPAGVAAASVRMHAVLSPPASPGTCISLRTITPSRAGVADLAAKQLMPPDVADAMVAAVRARKNILVSGGTGAGKTTLLAAMVAEVPENQRVILVEDTPELLPVHPHVVRLTTRRGNADGAGVIDMTELVRQCLRMRPDRIVVGEIRGAEIADLLTALNTGHAGSAGTVHANHPDAVPGRLMALGALAGMPPAAVVRQATDAIDLVVHLERTPAGRRLTHIAELGEQPAEGARPPQLRLRPLWNAGPTPGWKDFRAQVGAP